MFSSLSALTLQFLTNSLCFGQMVALKLLIKIWSVQRLAVFAEPFCQKQWKRRKFLSDLLWVEGVRVIEKGSYMSVNGTCTEKGIFVVVLKNYFVTWIMTAINISEEVCFFSYQGSWVQECFPLAIFCQDSQTRNAGLRVRSSSCWLQCRQRMSHWSWRRSKVTTPCLPKCLFYAPRWNTGHSNFWNGCS